MPEATPHHGIPIPPGGDTSLFAAGVRAALLAVDARLDRDTGWRALTHPNVSDGSIRLRRHGNVTHLSLEAATLVAGSDLSNLIPAGFNATIGANAYVYGRSVPYFSSNAQRSVRVHYLGHLQINGATAGDVLQLDMQWLTDDPWPATLPGAPA